METKTLANVVDPQESEKKLLDTGCGEVDVEIDAPERETWDRKLDFMLSCIGYAVGLGNIWRFPYLCYRNGGGAFLVPYFIFLVICGIPLFFLELTFGQFGSLGPVSIWKISPIFKGVGYCMLMISFLVCIYYNVIIAYALHYLYNSFSSTLPWATCDGSYFTEFCRDSATVVQQPPSWTNLTCGGAFGYFANIGNTSVNTTGFMANQVNKSQVLSYDGDNVTFAGSCVKFNTSAQEYFSLGVLQQSSGIGETGSLNTELLLALVVAWIIVFICLFKGVKWSGKVVYVTATFPYLVLFVLLIVGVQQEGAWIGIKFYIKPNLAKLSEISVWSDAAVQIFYSLGAAWGVLLNYSSLNKFNNNVYRDALFVSTINCMTSVLAGFVVFSVLGSLAYTTGRDIHEVVDQGCGLAFVAYPAAVVNLPYAPFCAVLFFMMLLSLGLDSQVTTFSSHFQRFVFISYHKYPYTHTPIYNQHCLKKPTAPPGFH